MRQFTHRNESFICANCGFSVEPSERSCRNHCPRCLYSVHLDIHPGDRAANCNGLMKPVRVEYNSKKGYQLVHRCLKCGHVSKNIVQQDVLVQPDDREAILRLMSHPED
ncbi:RNHCP domain-containing protein [Alicyclobacillus acidoterrestris]|uniref:RNHCP domain-containing protein n=1 Tax=Alicyclobacillus acidoterrestris (strain ATCC 49025 / DSM 3922 / CIP 106132 / NCIMB 13137 / GD3B) TaxID=1356854 RepID=A0A9E7CX46_ALIAG|nr:RNHCP domain-containing protein [Alicyclobacillus acidoterrestris]UNO47451.1 RNHCP domain-containing protein [Alicyclobacillus acidoterrestris]